MARRAGGRRLPLFGLEEMRKETVGHEAEYVPNGFVTDGCPGDSHCLSKIVSPWVGGWVIVHPVSLYCTPSVVVSSCGHRKISSASIIDLPYVVVTSRTVFSSR